MILYLGASSLVKLYVNEDNSDMVKEWVEEAEIVATCRIAYTEIISAFDARFRNNDIHKSDYNEAVKGFTQEWDNYVRVDFDERETGRLINKYGLRRFDAIHLSAALLIRKAGEHINIAFSSADERLNQAAEAEGLRIFSSAHKAVA